MKEYLKVKVMSLQAERRIIKTQGDRIQERLEKRKRWLDALKGKDKISREDAEALLAAKVETTRESEARIGLIIHEAGLAAMSRASHLAYGFVLGREYYQMEAKVRPDNRLTEKDVESIRAMVTKYDNRDKRTVEQKWEAFKQAIDNVPLIIPVHGSAQARKEKYHSRPRRTKSEYLASQMS